MIYLNLMGGLGNQLFQYAAGLTFSECEGILYIYKAHSNSHSKTDYRYLFKRGIPLDSKTHSYTLQLGAFDPWDPSQYPRPITLNGYFQNLPSLTSLPLVIQDLREALGLGPVSTCPSVPRGKTFIHVRRGDYITYSHLYGGVGENYYKKAMALFANTEFIVLSDDPAWCRTQTWLIGCEIIDEPDELKALAIMGSCEGAIIANSTFSWWGAMISAKQVVYPSKWFSSVKPDLFPKHWICL
jgi:hypothetical protein